MSELLPHTPRPATMANFQMDEKTCTRCGITQSCFDFGLNKSNKDMQSAWCNTCRGRWFVVDGSNPAVADGRHA